MDVEVALEQLASGFAEGGLFEDGGVVDEDGQLRELLPHLRDERGRIVMVVQVATEQPAPASEILDGPRRAFGRFRGGVIVKRHVVAVLRQRLGDGGADAPGSAGDEGGSFRHGHGAIITGYRCTHHRRGPEGPELLTVRLTGATVRDNNP